ncbi:hypothetical protein B5X24_HaOG208472 [Helicoverpa armigera]|uniref:Uncharacterized protein n=1 Tax=Helicoverpa armigera TaxID=29058 RepID=A0A2W1BQJ3_HELAM|nr:hypothetical protein B5X24_HaOG208472 [Helicoverpa armigera]
MALVAIGDRRPFMARTIAKECGLLFHSRATCHEWRECQQTWTKMPDYNCGLGKTSQLTQPKSTSGFYQEGRNQHETMLKPMSKPLWTFQNFEVGNEITLPYEI